MARRRELERRLRALGDIETILGVMKNLALMEVGKLARILGAEHEMVASLEAAAADFLAWYPQQEPVAGKVFAVLLLIGSQRGLCGDFNDLLLAAIPGSDSNGATPLRIAIGAKLSMGMQADIHLDGPHAVEEIGTVVHGVLKAINRQLPTPSNDHSLHLSALCHDPDSGVVGIRQLAPFAGHGEPQEPLALFPPQLNIAPAALFSQLTEQLLLASLTELFHRSLMAENRFRLNHIDGATRRMERRASELKRKQSLARQEEIIEEIEAILASAGMDAPQWAM